MKNKSFLKKIFSKKTSYKNKVVDSNEIVTPTKAIINNFMSNKLALTGLIGFIFIVIFVFGGSMFLKFDELYNEPILQNTEPGQNLLKFPKDLNGNVDQIQSGVTFTFATDKEGKLFYWGKQKEKIFNIPEKIKDKKILKYNVSDRHIIALTSTGELIAWGSNDSEESTIPENISRRVSAENVRQVIAGPLYSGVLLDDGKLFTWGSNNVQQRSFDSELNGKIKAVYPMSENIIILLEDNRVFVTGINSLAASVPSELKEGSVKIKKVVGAYLNAIALTEDGKVITWGAGGSGLDTPKTFDEKVVDVVAGRNHFTVLLESGKVVTWGDKAVLGEKDTPNSNYKQIFSNYFQTYGIKEDGTIDAWGLKGYLLGSDESGRDVYTRLVHGGKTSLLVGIVAVVITTLIGLVIGLISGFAGGTIDNLLMRFAEVVNAIPFLPLIITLSVVLGNSMTQTQRMYLVMVLIGLLSWVGLARLVRGQILIEREKDFVLAARALGIKQTKIVLKHILPSVLSIAIVSMSLSYGGMMLTEAGLSFLGFGVVPPTPTWGNMLNGAQQAEVIQLYWWRWIFPASAVFITVLAVNLVGDGIRDAVDPKSNEK